MCTVTFDQTAFLAAYPQFTAQAGSLAGNFLLAESYLNNTDCSIVACCTERALYLNLLVAHITTLFNGAGTTPASPLVGRISSATEGSVSVSAEMPGATASSAWYLQTPFGAAYWQATAKYRQARYIAGRSGPAPMAPGVLGLRGF